MKKFLITLAAFSSVLLGQAFAAPTLTSGTGGTIADGELYTINATGGGFGASAPDILYWCTLEGTNGATMSGTSCALGQLPIVTKLSGGNCEDVPTRYSTGIKRGNRTAAGLSTFRTDPDVSQLLNTTNRSNCYNTATAFDFTADEPEIFISIWQYRDIDPLNDPEYAPGVGSGNDKFWGLWSDSQKNGNTRVAGAMGEEDPLTIYVDYLGCDPVKREENNNNGCSRYIDMNGNNPNPDLDYDSMKNTWVNHLIYAKWSSAPGAFDGVLNYSQDNSSGFQVLDNRTARYDWYEYASGDNGFRRFTTPEYWSPWRGEANISPATGNACTTDESGNINEAACLPPNWPWNGACSLETKPWLNACGADADIYQQDLYVARERRRVMLCPTNDYTDGGCEIQPVSAVLNVGASWSNTSITFEINQGSIESLDDAYVFFVDDIANGDVSNGLNLVALPSGEQAPKITLDPPGGDGVFYTGEVLKLTGTCYEIADNQPTPCQAVEVWTGNQKQEVENLIITGTSYEVEFTLPVKNTGYPIWITTRGVDDDASPQTAFSKTISFGTSLPSGQLVTCEPGETASIETLASTRQINVICQ